MAPAPEDLRAHVRLPLVLQVEYPDREGYLADATENLSESGAFVRTDRTFEVGALIPLQLSFAGLMAPLEVQGQVVWARAQSGDLPAGVGVRIPEDRTDDRRQLADLLEKLQAARRGEAATRQRFRILLVEDNPHIMEMYEYVMKKLAKQDHLDIEVALAHDGFDALGRLSKETFHLVVTDLYMPVLDGFELIRKMRSDEKLRDIPVVAISAGGADAQVQANQVGASVYLRKPVRFVDVLDTVKSLLKL